MCSDACIELVNEMSKEIGKVNIYDIYEPCFSNLPDTVQRARYDIIMINIQNYQSGVTN